MAVDRTVADRVLKRIGDEEVVQLALTLGNIDSPTGKEKEVSDYILDWVRREGFVGRQVALLPERPNVLATHPGTGAGYSLIFNSHMDTSTPEKSDLFLQSRGPAGELAWVDGDQIVGHGVVNDKGPMAAFMIAGKAIKDEGIRLPGDLMLSMVCAETGYEPVDEFGSPQYIGREVGARYLITHGGYADYAVVAETTSFGLGYVEAGESYWKITVRGLGKHRYTPYIQRPVPPEENPNAIMHVARLLDAIEAWAYDYEQRHTYEGPGGKCVPKVNVGAMRSGKPYKISRTAQEAELYLDVRITPKQNPMDVREELRGVLAQARVQGEVELYCYLRGYEAQNVERLRDAIDRAHQQLFGKPVGPAPVPTTSMWRDCNCFNEVGIPAVTFGPGTGTGGGNFMMPVHALVQASKLYALTALHVCGQRRTP